MYQYIIIFSLILFSSQINANVIFPAFTAPYASAFLFPISLLVVLAAEIFIVVITCKNLSRAKAGLSVAFANIISWVAGILIAGLLPSGLITDEHGMLTSGPEFTKFALYGFVVAYVLSVIIEGGVYKILSNKLPISQPFKFSLYANTLSYTLLSLITWAII